MMKRIVLPILAIYRKYYGTVFTVRITALMVLTMIVAALIVAGVFDLLGLIPTGPRRRQWQDGLLLLGPLRGRV
jgi:hypothetical protein